MSGETNPEILVRDLQKLLSAGVNHFCQYSVGPKLPDNIPTNVSDRALHPNSLTDND